MIMCCFFCSSGSHTGNIEVLGGAGDPVYGGGGAGGRIAVYYRSHNGVKPYRGYYNTQGGSSSSGAEPGASGTAYIKDFTMDHKTLRVDNRNQFRKSEFKHIPNHGHRKDLTCGPESKASSFTCDGWTVTLSQHGVYNHGYGHPNYIHNANSKSLQIYEKLFSYN